MFIFRELRRSGIRIVATDQFDDSVLAGCRPGTIGLFPPVRQGLADIGGKILKSPCSCRFSLTTGRTVMALRRLCSNAFPASTVSTSGVVVIGLAVIKLQALRDTDSSLL